jgi:hypothetical protein
MMRNLPPNNSLHPTCYSGLRPLPQAGELKRWAAAVHRVRTSNSRGILTMLKRISQVTAFALMSMSAALAHAIIFDCDGWYKIESEERTFTISKSKSPTKYTIDTQSGLVLGDAKTWRFRVVQQGNANWDWVLLYLPELAGPYQSAEDVVKQGAHLGLFRIRAWKKGMPFFLDWGNGPEALGHCTQRM